MDFTKLTTAGLLMLHETVRDALLADDSTNGPKPFGVRETPDWRRWSDGIANELIRRGEQFKPIQW
jgi:hypothetical protein